MWLFRNKTGNIQNGHDLAVINPPPPKLFVDDDDNDVEMETDAGTGVMDYDLVFDIPSLTSIINMGGIKIHNPKNFTLDVSGKCAKIAVSGLFNRGKTFILGRIAGIDLPAGVFVSTKGLSLKVPLNKSMNKFMLIDTAGQFVPLKINDPNDWNDRVGTEAFLKQLMLDIADAHVFVVNEMTWPDQLEIRGVVTVLQEKNRAMSALTPHKTRFEDVFVIHNLKSYNIKEKNRYIRDRFKKFYPDSTRVYLDNSDEKDFYLSDAGTQTRHFFTVNDHTPEGHRFNNTVFARIRTELCVILSQLQQSNIFESIQQSANKHLRSYVQKTDTNNLSELVYDSNKSKTDAVRELRISDFTHNPNDYKVQQVDQPKGFVLDVRPQLEVDPPQRITEHTSSDGERKVVVMMDVPGIKDKNTINIDTSKWPEVTVTGNREKPSSYQNRSAVVVGGRQIAYGAFKSTFRLDATLDPQYAPTSKHLEDGVLSFTFPYLKLTTSMDEKDEKVPHSTNPPTTSKTNNTTPSSSNSPASPSLTPTSSPPKISSSVSNSTGHQRK